jgi:hypothetical protein
MFEPATKNRAAGSVFQSAWARIWLMRARSKRISPSPSRDRTRTGRRTFQRWLMEVHLEVIVT